VPLLHQASADHPDWSGNTIKFTINSKVINPDTLIKDTSPEKLINFFIRAQNGAADPLSVPVEPRQNSVLQQSPPPSARPSALSQSVMPPSGALAQMLELGIPEEAAKKALQREGNNASNAIEAYFRGNHDIAPQTPDPKFDQGVEEMLAVLAPEHSREECLNALMKTKNTEAAIDLIVNHPPTSKDWAKILTEISRDPLQLYNKGFIRPDSLHEFVLAPECYLYKNGSTFVSEDGFHAVKDQAFRDKLITEKERALPFVKYEDFLYPDNTPENTALRKTIAEMTEGQREMMIRLHKLGYSLGMVLQYLRVADFDEEATKKLLAAENLNIC
jgi:hypothetical protein